ncbi:MAG: hypothetical protein GOU99_00645 [Candidatus Altiarchaeota archaeon]|nr:hypothetical protein [Candidatus Altiarchaeota archaeon]
MKDLGLFEQLFRDSDTLSQTLGKIGELMVYAPDKQTTPSERVFNPIAKIKNGCDLSYCALGNPNIIEPDNEPSFVIDLTNIGQIGLPAQNEMYEITKTKFYRITDSKITELDEASTINLFGDSISEKEIIQDLEIVPTAFGNESAVILDNNIYVMYTTYRGTIQYLKTNLEVPSTSFV